MTIGIGSRDEFEDAFFNKTAELIITGGFVKLVISALENLGLPHIW